MFKKVIIGFLVLATSTVFGMSLSSINKASKSDLMEINGIGEVKAKAIMKARPFKSMADVVDVQGIGPQLVANMKNDVKSAENVKKVKKTTRKKTTSKTTKAKDTKSKTKADAKTKKKRKIKSIDEKKKELKTKAKKTKKKKTKAKKEKKTKSKKKN